jgi:hypothetical protein
MAEAVFDPRLGGRGKHGVVGTKYRDPKTGWFVPRPKELTFRCKFCEKDRPLAEMRMLTRFFPPLPACSECERKIG